MEKSKQLIDKLNELKECSSESSYSHILNILKNQHIPINYLETKPFKLIRYRRHNEKNKEILFYKSEDLSYRKDFLEIKNFGRANEPGQGFFYCNDNFNQSTGITEIVSVLRDNEKSKEEILTIGAWNVNNLLKLAVILPIDSTENLESNLTTPFYEKFKNHSEFEDLKIMNNFFANEFSLDIEKTNSNYKITSAFTNYIKYQYPEIDGIIYRSVKSELKGTNIVLWPEVVDEKLEFTAAKKSIFKLFKNKKFVEFDIIESKKYIKENDLIVW